MSDEPNFEQLLVDAMGFLTAPDQAYREAGAIVGLTVVTPRLRQAREKWEKHWAEYRVRHPER